jgi:hypothetical protein
MTVWRLVPIPAGVHIITRILAGADADHLVCVGELELRREDYGDLADRLGAPNAFDTVTGRPLPVRSAAPGPTGPVLPPADWGRTPLSGEGGLS